MRLIFGVESSENSNVKQCDVTVTFEFDGKDHDGNRLTEDDMKAVAEEILFEGRTSSTFFCGFEQ